ncbi:MAG: ribose-5-phosphate isomerase RpiA [Myxococcales bacterium]|nr:ribose-5-phosphate isomerase RpiA [Myxococcales bacterium]
MNDAPREKRAAAEAALAYVEPGMRLGLGTGSTATLFIDALGARVRDGLTISGVATSRASHEQALRVGIPLLDLDSVTELDLTVDGADEIDPAMNLIKGGGGALLREKIVASRSRGVVIVADSSKEVDTLGRFPLPVEVVPFWWNATAAALGTLGVEPRLRRSADGSPFLSDNGNLILDCPFGSIADPAELEWEISLVPGVVAVGLFVRMADVVLTGQSDGQVSCRGILDDE